MAFHPRIPFNSSSDRSETSSCRFKSGKFALVKCQTILYGLWSGIAFARVNAEERQVSAFWTDRRISAVSAAFAPYSVALQRRREECRNIGALGDAFEHRVGGGERLADRHIHIQITIGAKPADECHATRSPSPDRRISSALLLRPSGGLDNRECRSGPQDRLNSRYKYRAFKLVLLPRGEMLVLRYAGKGRGLVAVIDDGGALIVALRPEDLEIQRAVAKPARL